MPGARLVSAARALPRRPAPPPKDSTAPVRLVCSTSRSDGPSPETVVVFGRHRTCARTACGAAAGTFDHTLRATAAARCPALRAARATGPTATFRRGLVPDPPRWTMARATRTSVTPPARPPPQPPYALAARAPPPFSLAAATSPGSRSLPLVLPSTTRPRRPLWPPFVTRPAPLCGPPHRGAVGAGVPAPGGFRTSTWSGAHLYQRMRATGKVASTVLGVSCVYP